MKKRLALLIAVVLMLTFVFAACNGGKMDTPKNVAVNGSTLVWDNVESASSYKVSVDGTEFESRTNSYSLSGLTELKTYQLKVKAVGSGKKSDSDWSSAVAYTVSTAPVESLTAEEGARKVTEALLGLVNDIASATEKYSFEFSMTIDSTVNFDGIGMSPAATIEFKGALDFTNYSKSEASLVVTLDVPATISSAIGMEVPEKIEIYLKDSVLSIAFDESEIETVDISDDIPEGSGNPIGGMIETYFPNGLTYDALAAFVEGYMAELAEEEGIEDISMDALLEMLKEVATEEDGMSAIMMGALIEVLEIENLITMTQQDSVLTSKFDFAALSSIFAKAGLSLSEYINAYEPDMGVLAGRFHGWLGLYSIVDIVELLQEEKASEFAAFLSANEITDTDSYDIALEFYYDSELCEALFANAALAVAIINSEYYDYISDYEYDDAVNMRMVMLILGATKLTTTSTLDLTDGRINGGTFNLKLDITIPAAIASELMDAARTKDLKITADVNVSYTITVKEVYGTVPQGGDTTGGLSSAQIKTALQNAGYTVDDESAGGITVLVATKGLDMLQVMIFPSAALATEAKSTYDIAASMLGQTCKRDKNIVYYGTTAAIAVFDNIG